MLFLIVNAFAAVIACTVLLAALACATMLLPFCCVGVLVFRLLFRMRLVESLAKSDVMLVNFLSRSEDRIAVEAASENNDPLHPLLRRPNSPLRLAPGLDNVSAESLLVLFYFLTIKCICSLLGLCVVVLVLWAPVALLQLLFASVASSGDVTFWESICGVFTLSLVFAVAVFSLDMLVSLSCATTCFFCCDGEVRTLNPHPRPAAVTKVHARPNVTVVRFAPSSASSCNESM
uniref:Uncharacterized protein n=1 Tax=Globisporangium ultimum (strain ATCC 200006 / CBS 805.95 / DAOM BR144) TaxID=431595 RepID=K3WZ65_GLOUD